MDRERAAVAVGAGACVLVVALAVVPYLVASGTSVGAYYDAGLAGPPLVALFAVILVIVLAGGYRERTDPPLAAGIAVTVGAFAVVLSWWWALAVPADLVAGFTTVVEFRYHRWAFAGASLAAALAALAYARVVLAGREAF